MTTNEKNIIPADRHEEVAARNVVALAAEPIDLVPRIRPLLRGGCSDLIATVKHLRREHARSVRDLHVRAA